MWVQCGLRARIGGRGGVSEGGGTALPTSWQLCHCCGDGGLPPSFGARLDHRTQERWWKRHRRLSPLAVPCCWRPERTPDPTQTLPRPCQPICSSGSVTPCIPSPPPAASAKLKVIQNSLQELENNGPYASNLKRTISSVNRMRIMDVVHASGRVQVPCPPAAWPLIASARWHPFCSLRWPTVGQGPFPEDPPPGPTHLSWPATCQGTGGGRSRPVTAPATAHCDLFGAFRALPGPWPGLPGALPATVPQVRASSGGGPATWPWGPMSPTTPSTPSLLQGPQVVGFVLPTAPGSGVCQIIISNMNQAKYDSIMVPITQRSVPTRPELGWGLGAALTFAGGCGTHARAHTHTHARTCVGRSGACACISACVVRVMCGCGWP